MQVQIQVGSGDELAFELAGDGLIDSRKHQTGVAGMGQLRGDCDFHHGCDESRGNAVSGDIGDQDPEAQFVDDQEIEQVAGNAVYWQ